MKDLNLAGVQIGRLGWTEIGYPLLPTSHNGLFNAGSHVNDWNLDAKELEPFWEAAEELQAAILVHPWDMETGGRYSKYWAPWLVGECL